MTQKRPKKKSPEGDFEKFPKGNSLELLVAELFGFSLTLCLYPTIDPRDSSWLNFSEHRLTKLSPIWGILEPICEKESPLAFAYATFFR